ESFAALAAGSSRSRRASLSWFASARSLSCRLACAARAAAKSAPWTSRFSKALFASVSACTAVLSRRSGLFREQAAVQSRARQINGKEPLKLEHQLTDGFDFRA